MNTVSCLHVHDTTTSNLMGDASSQDMPVACADTVFGSAYAAVVMQVKCQCSMF